MSVTETKPVPVPNAETRPYWEGCAAQRLLIQRCSDCGQHQFYPRLLCIACASRAVTWREAAGHGVVKSFTIIRRAVSAAFEADVPYVVALITLAEGPTMMANIVQCDVERVVIGLAVTVTFEVRGEITVPQFKPV